MSKHRHWSLRLDEPGGIEEVKALEWDGPELTAGAEKQMKQGKAIACRLIDSGDIGSGPFRVHIAGVAGGQGELPEVVAEREPHLAVNVVAAP